MTERFTLKNTKIWLAAGAAALGLAVAAPAALAGNFTDKAVSFDGVNLNINDDEDLLQTLIDMDAEDIADLREEMADARADIKDAIGDVEEARREAKEDPKTAGFVDIAFAAASASVESSTRGVFDNVYAALDRAESNLDAGKVEVSDAEFEETSEAIAVIREELAGVEAALDELLAAMKSS
ncbi:hypothetical protein [Hyphococcus luteus]|nr:hypothetical protein [Marinicaulis flavus]